MQTDIVSRLLKSAETTVLDRAARGFKTDAATTIQAEAAAYIERLEEALEPFAKAAEAIDTYHDDQTGGQNPMADDWHVDTLVLGYFMDVCTMSDLRRARNTLKGGNDGQERET